MEEKQYPRDIINANLLAQNMDEWVVDEFTTVLNPTFSMHVFHMVWSSFNLMAKQVNYADMPTPWRSVYRCIVALAKTPLFDGPATYPRNVVHGHITDHPLFSTMAYQADWVDERYYYFFANLQFLLLCASIEAHRTGEEVSLSAISKVCLLTRQLTLSKYQPELAELALLFSNTNSNEIAPDETTESELAPLVQRFNGLAQYLETHKEHRALGIKFIALKTVVAIVAGSQALKPKRGRKELNRGPVIREVFCGGEDELTIITDSDVDEETEYQSQIVDGSAPNEVKSPRVQIIAPLPTNLSQGWQSSRQIAYRQQGMINAIAQRNQGLVYHVSRLQRSELQVILDYSHRTLSELTQTMQQNPTPPAGFVAMVDTHLAILLLLLTGMPLTELTDITLIKANNSNNLHIRPTADGSQILLSFKPPKHQLSQIKPERFAPLVHSPADYLELAIGDAFYPLLKLIFGLKRLEGLSWDQPILSTPAPALEEHIKQQIKSWNKAANSHISINRLNGWLHQAVFEYSGDLAACYYLANGRGHKPAQAYYVNYQHAHLQRLYSHVTSMGFVIDPAAPQNSIRDQHPAATTGSRLATKTINLPNVVTLLIDYVGKAASTLLADSIALHNRLVCYIYLMFAFGVGIRSVIDPLETINHVDLHSGAMLLNDKENRSVANCRYVILPKLLHQQLIAYRQHLKVLVGLLKSTNHALVAKVKAAIYGDNNTPMLFMINPERRLFERLSPKKLNGKLSQLLPVPLNMGRHYLRSELVRRNCPVYWIDAMLGHAEIGVEANSRFSALSFAALKRLTADHLNPLIEQAGWRVITGLGNKHG